MTFNEDSRVKIPALLHFRRLGYDYQTKKKIKIDVRNDISIGLPAEIEARGKQYEYYRKKLLTFKELEAKEA